MIVFIVVSECYMYERLQVRVGLSVEYIFHKYYNNNNDNNSDPVANINI